MLPWSAAQSVLRWPVWLAVGVVTTADAGEATVAGGIAAAPLAPARRRGAVLGCRGAGRPGGRIGADRPRAAGAGRAGYQRPAPFGLAGRSAGNRGAADQGQWQPVGATHRRRRPGNPGGRVRPPGATPQRAGPHALAWSTDRPVALRLGRGELRLPGDLPRPGTGHAAAGGGHRRGRSA